eukprot:769518-Rhodomonas_salina.2
MDLASEEAEREADAPVAEEVAEAQLVTDSEIPNKAVPIQTDTQPEIEEETATDPEIVDEINAESNATAGSSAETQHTVHRIPNADSTQRENDVSEGSPRAQSESGHHDQTRMVVENRRPRTACIPVRHTKRSLNHSLYDPLENSRAYSCMFNWRNPRLQLKSKAMDQGLFSEFIARQDRTYFSRKSTEHKENEMTNAERLLNRGLIPPVCPDLTDKKLVLRLVSNPKSDPREREDFFARQAAVTNRRIQRGRQDLPLPPSMQKYKPKKIVESTFNEFLQRQQQVAERQITRCKTPLPQKKV